MTRATDSQISAGFSSTRTGAPSRTPRCRSPARSHAPGWRHHLVAGMPVDGTANEVTVALERAATELAESDIQVRAIVRQGESADEIVDEVRVQDANLVIMRTHGRSGISRAVLVA